MRLKDKLGNDIFLTSGSANPSTAVATSGQADKTSTLSMNVADQRWSDKEVSLAMFRQT